MVVFIAFTGACLLLYALLILYYHWIWDRIPTGKKAPSGNPETMIAGSGEIASVHSLTVSVIIPARNEARHIEDCLESILHQSYPAALLEVIVVNDFSTDQTAALAEGAGNRVRLLNLADYTDEHSLHAHKKRAIETGISQASGELIVCTDADCTAEPEWIETLVRTFLDNQYQILAAPVKISTDGSLLSIFQALDFISLQGITGAALSKNLYPLCNGANLAYRRAAFYAVDGFKNIDHIASGDDMLLMAKMQERFPGKAGYLKDRRAIVTTAAADNLNVFFQQRIRWASKISHYGHSATFITLALVYVLNVCLLLLFLLSFRYETWHWLVTFLILKTFAEYFFVSKVAGFFQQRSLMSWFILCQPLHILYTVAAGSFGAFGNYRWKGRVMRKPSSTWRRLKKNHGAVFGMVLIVIAVVLAVFAYILAPDHSPDANRMTLETGGRKPGFQQIFLLIRKQRPIRQQSRIAVLFTGDDDRYDYVPVTGYAQQGDSLIIEKYIDEGISERRSFYHLPSGTDMQIRKKTFWLGTDRYGRDILSRLIIGVRVSLAVGLITVILSLSIGILLGAVAGYFGGRYDQIIMWFLNVIWSIPTLLLVFALTLLLGKGFWQVFIAIGLTMWVSVARLVRGQVLAARQLEYVEAARALGYSHIRIIGKHILPNIMGSVLVIAASNFASAIVIEAGLSFLGIGVQPPTPSWGLMIKENYNFIITHNPMLALVPGIAIMLLVLAFNLLGNGLRDALNVKE